MIEPKRFTIYLSAEEAGILDAISKRKKLSRSSVMRNLLVYQGLCGGDMPLTRKILGLPDRDRKKVLTEIKEKAEKNDPSIPQKWSEMVKDALGSADDVSQEKGADAILQKLLGH
jgi:hypothetical protein